jgi:hypothetical protein
MFIGAGTSAKLQVITSAASDVEVSASKVVVSNATPPVVDGTNSNWINLANISTAATTDVVVGVASTLTRVDELQIRNAHATTANTITVQRTDGTNVNTVFSCNLLAGESISYSNGMWVHYDVTGAPYAYGGPPVANLGLTNCIAETIPREICTETNTTVAASGTLFMQAIYLRAGQLISNITACSATTAAGTPTNYAFGLYDASRNLLANTANQTTTAWAANTIKTVALTSAYRVPTSGLYYIGYYMTATTVATLKGNTARTGGQLAGGAPIICGTSSTGLTTALPNPAAAITVGTAIVYFAVS